MCFPGIQRDDHKVEAFLMYQGGDQKGKENVRKEIVNTPESVLAPVYLQLNSLPASHLKKKKRM